MTRFQNGTTATRGARLIVHDREWHLDVWDDDPLEVGDTVEVIRGNGPREGDRMGVAIVTRFEAHGAPVLSVRFDGRPA